MLELGRNVIALFSLRLYFYDVWTVGVSEGLMWKRGETGMLGIDCCLKKACMLLELLDREHLTGIGRHGEYYFCALPRLWRQGSGCRSFA